MYYLINNEWRVYSMKKRNKIMIKTKYAIIVSFGILLYFILDYFNFPMKNIISLIIIIPSNIYYSKYLNYKKNSWIFIIILLCLVFIPLIIINMKNLEYITFNRITDGLIISALFFLIFNCFIYE